MIKTPLKSRAKRGLALAHDEFFNDLRKREYNRLDNDGQVYLDYTGGNLYAESQLRHHFELLREHTFGNPHSANPSSKFSTRLIKNARRKIIEFFNADDYYCVFTANASAALKIVGESYPFERGGRFLLFSDNHNSVNGIREYCNSAGGFHEYVPMNFNDLSVSKEVLLDKLNDTTGENKLFAFPAQSNMSGVKHDLNWIKEAKERGWDVLLDAAAFVPTSSLDLSVYTPDFVSISFYKIFGYPTGLGCLLVRKSAFYKLQKKWFAGGTVSLASAKASYHFLTENHERFEDGTVSYLDIPALSIGLDYINSIGMGRINERVGSLIDYLYNRLEGLTHSNGEKQLTVLGNRNQGNTGGTMIMSFINPNGSKIRFEKIDSLAKEKGISTRSGCFCNPGLDETNNCLTTSELTAYFTSRTRGDYWDMIDFLQKMRGATRVSVGLATNKRDLDEFVNFVKSLQNRTIL
ncbi:MAG: aminotransferase class V-fold PLP-dependent enzyme [Crocinitomicaceae bacterium]|nr:aminotransferase class V-fold PLP-dependent enzyme [Crocinitomicaceae bacterium]